MTLPDDATQVLDLLAGVTVVAARLRDERDAYKDERDAARADADQLRAQLDQALAVLDEIRQGVWQLEHELHAQDAVRRARRILRGQGEALAADAPAASEPEVKP